MITVIDYGLGNRGSILNVLKRVGISARLSAEPAEIAAAERLILPGVGAFDAGMKNLADRGLIDPIRGAVLERRAPILGICLGMQLMCEGSEEGALPGLCFIKGRCARFDAAKSDAPIKIPHMGWSELEMARPGVLFAGETRARFYFVHSYHVVCEDEADVAAKATYGETFTAAVARDRVYGVQFHPEKSHRFGMRLLQRFGSAT